MKVACIQMVSSPDWQDNLAQAQRLIAEAAQAGAELVVLPEYFCQIGHRDTDKLSIAENWQGLNHAPDAATYPLQGFLSDQARTHQLCLVGGTIPLRGDAPDRVYNSSLAFAPDGRCVARYDKIHLFCFDNGTESYDEARVLQAGHTPTTFDHTDKTGHTWRLGLSVCYDLRFPELYRHLQADLILAPSAFTHTTGQAHWEVLLRARAIENLAYVAASAQGGTHANGRRTWGQSLIASPWGEVIAQQAQGAGVVMADLNPAFLAQCRRNLPALTHRRLS